jgi:hypothetical protein
VGLVYTRLDGGTERDSVRGTPDSGSISRFVMYDRQQARRGEVCTTECSSGILKRGAGITTYLYILQRWGSGQHWNYRPIPQPAPGKAGHYSWRYSYETLLMARIPPHPPPPSGPTSTRRACVQQTKAAHPPREAGRRRWRHRTESMETQSLCGIAAVGVLQYPSGIGAEGRAAVLIPNALSALTNTALGARRMRCRPV